MTTPFVCERVERRHPQEKCASKGVGTPRAMRARGPRHSRNCSLCLHLFFSTDDLRLEISRVRFEI